MFLPPQKKKKKVFSTQLSSSRNFLLILSPAYVYLLYHHLTSLAVFPSLTSLSNSRITNCLCVCSICSNLNLSVKHGWPQLYTRFPEEIPLMSCTQMYLAQIVSRLLEILPSHRGSHFPPLQDGHTSGSTQDWKNPPPNFIAIYVLFCSPVKINNITS